MIVIDVGCARYGGDYSLERLIEWYEPDTLYGFDPNPTGAREAAWWMPAPKRNEVMSVRYEHHVEQTHVVIEAMAAWTFDGQMGLFADGLASWVGEGDKLPRVPCIDLARFIGELPAGPVVLKLDCEGAEYPLLRHLIDCKMDMRLDEVHVEWHAPELERAQLEKDFGVELKEWRW